MAEKEKAARVPPAAEPRPRGWGVTVLPRWPKTGRNGLTPGGQPVTGVPREVILNASEDASATDATAAVGVESAS